MNAAYTGAGGPERRGPDRGEHPPTGGLAVAPVDPVAELERQTRSLVANAVDKFEVAAGLEADGLTDRGAQKRYGASDVFSLADRLYAKAPARPDEPEVSDALLPVVTPVKHALRGALFALPGVSITVITPHAAAAGGGVPLLIIALLGSWAFAQGLAYLGYLRSGWGEPEAASFLMRWGMLGGGSALLALVLGLGLWLDTPVLMITVAAGQATYLLAATVALVRGAEWPLLAAIAPAVLAGGYQLVNGGAMELVWITTGVSLSATIILALWCTRDATRTPLPPRTDLIDASRHALGGLLVSSLLLFPPVMAGTLMPSTGLLGLLAVALSASMGAAEWLMSRFRLQVYRLRQAATDFEEFVALATQRFLRMATGYLFSVTGLSGLVMLGWLVSGARWPRTAEFTGCFGYLALGAAVFIGLFLQSTGRMNAVLIGYSSLLAAEILGLLVVVFGPWRISLSAMTFVGSVLLFVLLLGYAVVRLPRDIRVL